MGAPRRTRRVTLQVAIPNGTPAGTILQTKEIPFDKKFPYLIGVNATVVAAAGGNSYLQTGVSDSVVGNQFDPSHEKQLDTDKAVPQDKKFAEIFIDNDGRQIYGIVKIPNLTTDANGKVDFTFLLASTLEEVK